MNRNKTTNIRFGFLLFFFALCPSLLPDVAQAQEGGGKTMSFDLDEEQLTIEADIPSVDLILSFREIQERNQGMKESFLNEIIESAKNPPF